MPNNRQDLEGWLNDRNCELRNAMEFEDVGLVAHVGGLVGQGATQLGLLGSSPRCAHGWPISISSHVKFDRRPSEAAVFGPRCRSIGHSKCVCGVCVLCVCLGCVGCVRLNT